MKQIALFGFGHLGRFHAQKIESIPEASLRWIIEPDQERAQLAKQEFPETKVSSEWPSSDDLPDGAVITTPTQYHYQMVLWCLENDIPCFCEKPLCATYEEALKLKEKISQAKDDKKFWIQVGQSERFHHIWTDVKNKIAKESSPPFVIKIERSGPAKGRALDVGVIEDLGIHDFDTLNYLLDAQIVDAKGYKKSILSTGIDFAELILTYSQSTTAFVSLNRMTPSETRSLTIFWKSESWEIDLLNLRSRKMVLEKGTHGLVSEWESYPRRDHLLEEQRCFVQLLHGRGKNPVPFEAGFQAMKALGLCSQLPESH